MIIHTEKKYKPGYYGNVIDTRFSLELKNVKVISSKKEGDHYVTEIEDDEDNYLLTELKKYLELEKSIDDCNLSVNIENALKTIGETVLYFKSILHAINTIITVTVQGEKPTRVK